MEDASDGPLTSIDTMPVPVKNGEVLPTQEPEVASEKESSSDIKSVKVNGDTNADDSDAVDSSDCDTLVIDERPQNNRKRKLLSLESKGGFRGFKRLKSENEYEPPTNPYFNESLFELSELHQNKNIHSSDKNCEENSKSGDSNDIQGAKEKSNSSSVAATQSKKGIGKKNKKNGSPKLREYAQYLGLQPTVQFKCSRCAQSGFPSLAVLNEHHKQCRALGPITPPISSNSSSSPSTNFRVTRKVFLCSACGTYYENWNLFLHMREVHKRFICLYCLGMFSLPEKLSLHLVSKHNCVPNQLNSEEDFFQAYTEPCFLMCCDCEKVFSERDNFFGHNCLGKPNRSNTENKNKNVANTNRHLANQKQVVNKNSKQVKSKGFVEHVTGDMPESEASIPKENDTMDMEAINSDNNSSEQQEQDKEKSENNLSPPEENNKENMEAKRENDLEETNSSPDAPNEMEDEVDTNPKISNNNSDVTETNTELKDVETETDLPNNNETNLDTTEYNHVQSKESASEDDLEESATEFPTKNDSESSLDIATTPKDEENLHINTEEQEDEFDETIKSEPEPEETRKVPKVTLKLPKSIATNYAEHEHEDSDGSDKLTMELDSMEAEGETDFNADISEEKENKDSLNISEPSMVVAGTDIPIVELELEQPLDKFEIQLLLQKCLKATVPTCVYCNHARKIAVNGKQLGLHAIAEHRFSAIVNSITAEELIPESFVMRIKEGLPELQDIYFNLESTSSDEGITFSHVFECFQCRYATTVHKELYLHNRKMHAKTILLCIMCKSNFYSYSELICHLCPGLYELNNDVNFRCCMCVSDDLPSAFRLMVHLRKRHHACDVCLELCHNQSRLSNHVWKHKLHHLCYRCGIAYRNKPDITKHLFWKHGTESVLCKKCLQKKWPHVYHFCIPPTNFTCEECNLNFIKAVSLKVHKRLHTDEKPHVCTFENCTEKFISKKLLLKHEFKHREPPEESLDKNHAPVSDDIDSQQILPTNVDPEEKPEEVVKDETPEEEVEKPKPKLKVDVYDLPELNLSESDSSDSEDEAQKNEKKEEIESEDEKMPADMNTTLSAEGETAKSESVVESTEVSEGVSGDQPAPVLENIWDDFKNYQASKEKMDTGADAAVPEEVEPMPSTSQEANSDENRQYLVSIVMMDHDYSVLSQEYKTDVTPESIERTQSMDHDYCSATNQKEQIEPEQPADSQKIQSSAAPKEKKDSKVSSSSDSSGSDSSSCTCGSNCSCSSSSDSSSSSSDSSDSDSSSSEGRRKQQARRERRKQRAKNKNKESGNSPIDVVATDQQPSGQVEQLIQESDLDTTETDTDEDFYDKQPQKIANKLIAEKRKELLLLAGIGPLINGSVLESSRPSTPSLPETEEVKPKKKSKNKKKKKKSRRQEEKPLPTLNIPSTSYQYQYQPSTVSPLTISLPKNSPLTISTPAHASPPVITGNPAGFSADEQMLAPNMDSDSSLRASKRRRIPNKFYGYTSDDERERHQPPVFKWRKADLPSPARPAPSSPLVVPPITIKTVPAIAVVEDPQSPARPSLQISERIQHPGLMQQNFQAHHSKALIASQAQNQESSTESNESSSEEEPQQPPPFINKPNQPPLYCYCRCPYDEVSEMIGCDANDCMIEWFHFECVGIMVPPKGQWFCPDCRKKKQQRKELAQT